MITYIKHLKLFVNIVLLTVVFHSCTKHETGQFDFNKLKKKINSYPVYERINKWDSLIKSNLNDTLTPYLYHQRGNAYYFMDKIDYAIKDFATAVKLFEKGNNKKMLAESYLHLGAAYTDIDQSVTAGPYIFKGLDIGKELNDPEIISHAYTELAHIYYLNDDIDNTIKYLKKTAGLYKKIKDTIGLSLIYNNIAMVYKKKKNVKPAIQYLNKILDLHIEAKLEPYNLMILYTNLGCLTFEETKNKNKAYKYFNKALKIANRNKIKPVRTYRNIALMYEKLNEIDSAEFYIQKAIKIYDKNDKHKIKLYNKLIKLILKQKKDTSTLNILVIRDSLDKLNKKMLEKNNQIALESNLKILNQQKELSQAKKINKKNKIIFSFIIILFILGLVLSFQFNRFDTLKHKQELVILEQKILRSQMNPHFIFNVLSSIQSSLLEKKQMVSATYLSKFAKLMRQNFDYIQKRKIPIKDELDLIKNYLDTQKFRFKDKFDYVINVDDKLKTDKYFIPPMILQPFVENAIKHGFANIPYKGLITINVLKKDDKICFEIIDNGTGYNPPKKDNKEHAMDIFKKRLFILGKETYDSFKITRLNPGTKVEFCFNKKL